MFVAAQTPLLRTPRRYAHGEVLLATFVSARRPLVLGDLLDVMADSGARLSDVTEWLAGAQRDGLVDDMGYEIGEHGLPVGPRRYTLSVEARAELRPRRSARHRRRAVAA